MKLTRRNFLRGGVLTALTLGLGKGASVDSVTPIAEPQATEVNPWLPLCWAPPSDFIRGYGNAPILEARESVRPGTHTYTFDMSQVICPEPSWAKPRSPKLHGVPLRAGWPSEEDSQE